MGSLLVHDTHQYIVKHEGQKTENKRVTLFTLFMNIAPKRCDCAIENVVEV